MTIRVADRSLAIPPSAVGRTASRRISRALLDAHVLLAFALIVPVLAIQLVVGLDDWRVVTAASAIFLAAQLALRRLRGRLPAGGLHLARLLVATIFVTLASRLGPGDADTPPFLVLSIPIVVFAAMLGPRQAVFVGAAALIGYGLAVSSRAAITSDVLERGIVLGVTALVLSVGTRRSVASLEDALASARRAMATNRRRDRQLAAIEAVGGLLAHAGPTGDALGGVVDLLAERLGYGFASIYLGDRRRMRLGAQRGYSDPVPEFEPAAGVVGRVMRTGQAQLVRDVRRDADYTRKRDNVLSMISVPLVAGGELIGVVNIETAWPRSLDERDLAAMRLVGDRLTSSLVLARERERLARRVVAFERLTAFAQALTATLEPQALYERIPPLLSAVIRCDLVTLTIRDAATNEYRVAAMPGGEDRFVGRPIQPGEGMAGRAISERRLIVEERYRRVRGPSGLEAAHLPDELAVAAVPLIREEIVIGAISLARFDVDDPFDDLDLEVLPLIGSHAALAIANAQLHQAAAEASIRDPLTGLYNRRHLDASLQRLSAARRRLEPGERRPLSVVLFDLDRFGQFNKRYGHAAGDEVLRAFAGILRDRTRASDLLARFGGEEFVVALDGATRDEAVRFADEIRSSLAAARIEGPHGERLGATVSAGCAGLDREAAALDGLLEIADVGLAMAKQSGRNRVVAA